jgi:phage shock protein PspC (stress-responsive transcriptional regulator)
MNKIININLAGRLIPIDESAYDQLRDYLNRLKAFFSREEGGDEIVRDMEDRMGELFQDKLNKGIPCIMAEDINDMIGIMGSPEQIENEAGEEEPARGRAGRQEAQAAAEPSKPKHLSRSKRDKLIGGVCGGLASYFNIDPIIIRIALIIITMAWGAGIIVYLLLWAILPENDDNTSVVKRRLYRNPKQKVVGGVCSGIAAYANIDPIIPRIIFATPLLGMVFFGILDNGIFFFPVLVGGLPTLVILYIILWASLPEATTLAEKLEMRGEKVDVHNLSQAIKGTETERVEGRKRSGLAQLFVVLIKVFVFFILGIVMLSLAAVIIAGLAAMFGVATSSALIFPFSELITESAVHRTMLWICVALTLIIPFITVIRLLVRVITGRSMKNSRWLTLTMTALFIIGVFGLFWVGTTIASDFKTSYRKTYPLTLNQPANDTLIIRQNTLDDGGEVEDDGWDNDGIRFRDDSTIAISNISLEIERSPDSLFHLSVQKSAHGRNSRRAQELAVPLEFNYRQEGNTLYLPKDFTLPEGHPFRAQKLKVQLLVPQGKVFRPEGIISSYYTDRAFEMRPGRLRYRTVNYPEWKDDEYYQMGADGPIGPKEEEEQNDNSASGDPDTDSL